MVEGNTLSTVPFQKPHSDVERVTADKISGWKRGNVISKKQKESTWFWMASAVRKLIYKKHFSSYESHLETKQFSSPAAVCKAHSSAKLGQTPATFFSVPYML